jgi:asparagine synthetase B (glutamine-hydrolysing)
MLRRGNVMGLARHMAGALTPRGNPHLLLEAPKMLRRYLERRGAGADARRRVGEILAMSDQQRRIYEIRELHLPRLLKWDDRNFMAHSVEGRYPFLDHVVIETALRFAPNALHHRGWTKEPIRRGLAAELPASIARRRSKLGFPAPQERWLTGPLRRAIDDWLVQDSPLWEHCDRNELQRVAETTWRTLALIPSQTLLRGWLADRWLRLFFS